MGQKGGLGGVQSKKLEMEEPDMELNAILLDHRAWFKPVFIVYNTGNNTRNADIGMYGGAPDYIIGTLVNKAHIVNALPPTTMNPNIVRDLKDFVPKARKRMQDVITTTKPDIKAQLMPQEGCSLKAYIIFVCSVFRELAPMLPTTAVNASTVTINKNIIVFFGRFEGKVMAFIIINGNSYEIYSPIPLVNALLISDKKIMRSNVDISLDKIPLITKAMDKLDMTTLGIIMQEPEEDHTIHVVSDVTIITSDTRVSIPQIPEILALSSSSSSSPVTQKVPTIIELATYK